MMADIFIERMVKLKTTPGSVLIKMLAVFGVFVAAILPFVIYFITKISLITVWPVLVAFSIWGAYKIIKRQNVEYEYILTNGEMDVDKIMGKNTRKRLLTVDCRSFEFLLPLTKEYEREYNAQGIGKYLDVSSGTESEKCWFCIYPGKDGNRTCLVFEPDDRMLEAFKRIIPSKIKR